MARPVFGRRERTAQGRRRRVRSRPHPRRGGPPRSRPVRRPVPEVPRPGVRLRALRARRPPRRGGRDGARRSCARWPRCRASGSRRARRTAPRRPRSASGCSGSRATSSPTSAAPAGAARPRRSTSRWAPASRSRTARTSRPRRWPATRRPGRCARCRAPRRPAPGPGAAVRGRDEHGGDRRACSAAPRAPSASSSTGRWAPWRKELGREAARPDGDRRGRPGRGPGPPLPDRDRAGVEALVADRYLDALLGRRRPPCRRRPGRRVARPRSFARPRAALRRTARPRASLVPVRGAPRGAARRQLAAAQARPVAAAGGGAGVSVLAFRPARGPAPRTRCSTRSSRATSTPRTTRRRTARRRARAAPRGDRARCIVGGAITSAAISLVGVAWVAWRATHPPTGP